MKDEALRDLLRRVVDAANARIKALNGSKAAAITGHRPSEREVQNQHETVERWHAVRQEAYVALAARPASIEPARIDLDAGIADGSIKVGDYWREHGRSRARLHRGPVERDSVHR